LSVEHLQQILISEKNTLTFRRSLLSWYRRYGRDLPWRRTRDPYAVLVSEFMLQQTQVATVIPYYNKWLRRFPDLAALARASESDVLHAWQGLGYYARARNLHATAKAIVNGHGGEFPQLTEDLQSLPGVGRYTANAIATFASGRSVPIVEANIARVLARIINYQQPIDSGRGREAIWQIASTLVPARGARGFNSALMDLGALICRPRPKCHVCPVRRFCRASKPETLPQKRSRPQLKKLTESHLWIRNRGCILLHQSSGRWRGMWILPPLKAIPATGRAIYRSVFPFTHHQVTLQIFAQPPRKIDKQKQQWINIDSINSIPIPSPHHRAITDLLGARN
jgi:A/G-specific adenine glycosylase